MANLLADLANTQIDTATGAVSTKTASAGPDPKSTVDLDKVAAAKREMLAAIQDVNTHVSHAEKTAGAGIDVSEHLMKMASDVANAEEQAMLKQAQLLGAAAADGFVARLNQHGAVAPQSEKTAGEDEIKLAMEAGYNDGLQFVEQARRGTMGKQADHQQGYGDTVAQIQQLAQTAEGQQKLAAIQQGYDNTMAYAEKLAADCTARGYHDTIAVLQRLVPQGV